MKQISTGGGVVQEAEHCKSSGGDIRIPNSQETDPRPIASPSGSFELLESSQHPPQFPAAVDSTGDELNPQATLTSCDIIETHATSNLPPLALPKSSVPTSVPAATSGHRTAPLFKRRNSSPQTFPALMRSRSSSGNSYSLFPRFNADFSISRDSLQSRSNSWDGLDTPSLDFNPDGPLSRHEKHWLGLIGISR